jgi:hypothetical protein
VDDKNRPLDRPSPSFASASLREAFGTEGRSAIRARRIACRSPRKRESRTKVLDTFGSLRKMRTQLPTTEGQRESDVPADGGFPV